jgi:Uma2 family endonuclease
MAQFTPTRVRAADYFDLPEYAQHDLIQLIDGEVVVGMPPIILHQRIVMRIIALFLSVAEKQGGEVLSAPTEVYLDEHSVYEPDVLYLTPQSACNVEEKRLVGPPELVVEVLSPGTAKHDRQQKYRGYERSGVREYWIVDPAHTVIEVWTGDEGRFERIGAYGPGDTFTSPVLGEPVEVAPIFGASQE